MQGTHHITLDSVVVAARDQVSSDLGDEIAILGLRLNTYYSVAGTSRRIWQLLQTARPASELHAMLLSRYAVDSDRCREDLLALLQRLLEEGLVEVVDAVPR